MRAWLKLLDPRTRIDDAAQAGVAARIGAVAIFASAPSSLLSLVFRNLSPEAMVATVELTASTPEERQILEAMTAMTPQLIGLMVVVTILSSGVLGALQWRYRTWIIPAICLLWTGYDALMVPLEWTDEVVSLVRNDSPLWLTVFEIAVLPVGIAMFWAAFRGGRWLERHRREQEAPQTV
ncbi:hypothetical protein [Phenylobacterium sp. 58.2.17]|uniref:hypothetical protein n=1 Tax=Phenylobacterium sp. 58.2.17 TaxID=2969306 RepID=UPI00226452BC|nr:hypothetical protein [Phenylobacterium sp. 58.2.17]MCX7587223.1 hypothetical protein [Phenylobacterium sp. 58.2.17]